MLLTDLVTPSDLFETCKHLVENQTPMDLQNMDRIMPLARILSADDNRQLPFVATALFILDATMRRVDDRVPN